MFFMNFFDHKDLGNHLLQLCPKVVKHPVLCGRNKTVVKKHESGVKKENMKMEIQNGVKGKE